MEYPKNGFEYAKQLKEFLNRLNESEQKFLIDTIYQKEFYNCIFLESEFFHTNEPTIRQYQNYIGRLFFSLLKEAIRKKSEIAFIFNLHTLPDLHTNIFLLDIEKLNDIENLDPLILELYNLLKNCLTAQLEQPLQHH